MSLEGGVGGATPTGIPPSGVSATQVQGTAAAGAAPVGNPVANGVFDGVNEQFQRSAGFSVGAAGVAVVATGTPVVNSSGDSPNAAAVATLPAAAGKTTYITGFQMTASGSTAALVVVATVTGTFSSNMSFVFTFPAGAAVAAQTLAVSFPQPIPATAVNTAIVVTLPAGGAGNLHAACVAQGFQL